MGVAAAKPRTTVSEYLQRERESLDRHEYRDGEIVLIRRGSSDHSLIVANAIGELGQRLKGDPCHVYDSNLRVRIQKADLYTYPDAAVICGQRELDPNDSSGETVTNPSIIVEVLSASTEAYDRGEKFDRYRQLDSLQEYVLISQVTPRIETFTRQGRGDWLLTPVSGLSASARIKSLEIDLPLAEVYAGIEFPPE